MTTSGFEGVEKRLELVFKKSMGESLRTRLTADIWKVILQPVDCMIEDSLVSHSVDTYLLSASSLFVFDDRVVIKTCGNTKVFEAISLILVHFKQDPIGVKFTRGSYRWPEQQPFPHQSFHTEMINLSLILPFDDVVTERMGSLSETFHVIAGASPAADLPPSFLLSRHSTVEILMTGLDKSKASVFFQESGRGPMISASGIDQLFPGSKICAMEFPECGFSMNGIVGESVYTIHVTPEDGFSFASFELVHFEPHKVDLGGLVESVIGCFDPANFTIAIMGSSKCSEELKVKNRVVQWRDIKPVGAWGYLECFYF